MLKHNFTRLLHGPRKIIKRPSPSFFEYIRLRSWAAFVVLFLFLFPPYIQSSVKYLEEADEALLAGRYRQAVSHYLKALNYAGPRQKPLVWDDLGLAYLYLGRLEKAEDYLRMAVRNEPENYDARLYLSAVSLLRGQEDEAFRELDAINKSIYFDHSWTWKSDEMDFFHPEGRRVTEDEWMGLKRERGVFLKEQVLSGKRPQAFVYIDALHEGNEGLLHFLRAVIFSNRGQTTDSERTFRAARAAGYPVERILEEMKTGADVSGISFIQLKPDHLSIQHRFREHRIGLLREKLIEFQDVLESGNLSQGVSILYQALDLDAESFHANHNLGLLFLDQALMSENDLFLLEKAEQHCARALWYHSEQNIKPKDLISCLDLMANIYFQKSDFETARLEYEKILEMDSSNKTARYNLGCSYYNLRDLDKAETMWTRILDDHEKERTDADHGEPEAAPHSLTVYRTPIVYLTYRALGNLYFSQKKFSEAAKKLRQAVSMRPRKADPFFNLAVALAEEGDREEAVDYMETYLYLGGPRETEARDRLSKWKR
ncbi:MAG: tetratricopeptide repeat protein [Candidatus Aminicenantes bacterium]